MYSVKLFETFLA